MWTLQQHKERSWHDIPALTAETGDLSEIAILLLLALVLAALLGPFIWLPLKDLQGSFRTKEYIRRKLSEDKQ